MHATGEYTIAIDRERLSLAIWWAEAKERCWWLIGQSG